MCGKGTNQKFYMVAYDTLGGCAATAVEFHVSDYYNAPGAYAKFYRSTMLDNLTDFKL